MILAIKLHLGSPLALPKRGVLLGDALLHAAATRLLYPDAAHRTPDQWAPISLPVKTVETEAGPMYAVSAMRTSRMVRHTDTIYKRTWKQFRENERKSGPLKASMTQLDLVAVPYLEFLVDSDQIDDLHPLVDRLSHMAVGFKTSAGYGQIVRVAVTRSEAPSALADIDGTVLRPIPSEYAEAHGYRGVKRLHAVAPPYFAAPEVLCIARDFEAIQWIHEGGKES